MAIIKCPECGKDISEKAAHCIHCGYPIKPRPALSAPAAPRLPRLQPIQPRPAQPVPAAPQEGCFLKTMNVGCLIIIVIAILIFLNAIFLRF